MNFLHWNVTGIGNYVTRIALKNLGLICIYPPVIWASSGLPPCKKQSLDFNPVK